MLSPLACNVEAVGSVTVDTVVVPLLTLLGFGRQTVGSSASDLVLTK